VQNAKFVCLFTANSEFCTRNYINHFLSADTIIPNQTNPASWNRYSYVNNNPLRYTDPTGHRACGDGEGVDCNGKKQDPSKNPHPPKHPKPNKDKDKDKKTRDPDYVTLNIGGSIPGLGTIVSGQGALTLDQYGNLYFGLGLALGPEAPLGFSASLSAGWLDTWSNSLTPGNGILSSSRKGLNMVYLALTKETEEPCPSPRLKIIESYNLNKC
jgi:hypothetical protein